MPNIKLVLLCFHHLQYILNLQGMQIVKRYGVATKDMVV